MKRPAFKKLFVISLFCGLVGGGSSALASVIDVADDVAETNVPSPEEQARAAKKRALPKTNINFALETSDPIPFSLGVVNNQTEKITWSQLNYGGIKFFDGGNLSFGGQFIDGYTELAAQLGFRMVKGNFVSGSVNGVGTLESYSAFFVPVRFYVRFTNFKWKVRPYAGLFAGVNVGSVSFVDSHSETKEPIVQFDAGARAGLDFDIVRGFGFGLYFEGELSTKQQISGSAPLSMTGMRAGLSLFYHFRRHPTDIQREEASSDDITQSYKNMQEAEERQREEERLAAEKAKEAEETRMKQAFDEIRKGDDAKFDRRCDLAIGFYKRGISYLPKNRDAGKNIEVPVRLDWANCLIELDKIKDALKVLQEANRIDPGNMQVIDAIEAIGGEVEVVKEEPVKAPVADPVKDEPENDGRRPVGPAEQDLAPVEPLDGVEPLEE